MKKAILSLCIIIATCLIMMCAICSFAENENENTFLIHNGTQFGMTMDEVIKCEE